MRILDSRGRFADVRVASAPSLLTEGIPATSSSVELVGLADGTRVFRDYEAIYESNPWLWASVDVLARGQARLPLKVYRQNDDGTVERVRPGTASRAATLAAALRRPGDGISSRRLWRVTRVDRLVWGNACWFPDRDRTGAYLGIRRIPWRHVHFERIAGVLRYWDLRDDKKKRLADDVVHFGIQVGEADPGDTWRYSSDRIASPSPIKTLHATLALYDAVERHLVAFFQNSARPSAHVKVAAGMKKPELDLIRDEIERLYTSPENAGRVVLTSGEWSNITQSPEHMRVVELAKQAREEIVAAYAVPPPLVGILERAIMSNVRELRVHYIRDVVGPNAEDDEGDIDAQILARDAQLADNLVMFETGAMLQSDIEARAKTYKDQRYVRSLNEIRTQLEDLPRIEHPDADMPWMPLNEKPLGASNAPEDDDEDDDEKPPAPEEDEDDE